VHEQSSHLLPPARIVGENSRQVTQRQVQQCRRDVCPGIMGTRTAIEQLDMKRPAPIAEWSTPGDPHQPITPTSSYAW
jgi:hypothetical protein